MSAKKPEMTIAEAFRMQPTCYGGIEPSAYALVRTYRYVRHDMHWRAVNALQYAKDLVSAGKPKYPTYGHSKFGQPFANGKHRGADVLRWIDNPSAAGLRLVAKSDIGYHATYGDDPFYGAVYLLPARRGQAVLVAGYLSPWRDNAAAICLDVLPTDIDSDGDYRNSDALREALASADHIANVASEVQREADEEDARDQEAEQLQQTIRDLRVERRTLLAEVRASGGLPPAICDTLRKRVYSIRRESREAHKRLAAIECGH